MTAEQEQAIRRRLIDGMSRDKLIATIVHHLRCVARSQYDGPYSTPRDWYSASVFSGWKAA